MNDKMKARNITAWVLAGFLITAALAVPVSAGGGGSAPKDKTNYFDITIVPEKSMFAPGDVMKIKITVKDKETHEPVEGAKVTVNMSVYQGHFTETKEIRTENGDGICVVEQTTIKSILDPILAEEEGNGIYVVEKDLSTKADLGGVTLKVTVEKDGKVDGVERVISFMGVDPWVYAVGSTLLAVICGLGIGLIFGGIKH
ncbi:MAG: hypothetical protein A7316_00340 [Candidatus Altiarchaeales archaeon WOR_SM1_86-2]|nr:MAG: hypothetical protein A7316_00340 [Candidatus Altiarchaeales archaeon WOR_SM1_86-2]ODS41315.1 MAG: hypothetical protein A7315_06645 [Candidatus Altiarchaeales archaeon WOR_SM1_79]